MKLLNKELETAIETALLLAQESGELPRFEIPRIPVSAPKRADQGDLSYPAMGLARLARKKPLDIASLIADKLPALDFASEVQVAPPGFINCFIANAYLKRKVDADL